MQDALGIPDKIYFGHESPNPSALIKLQKHEWNNSTVSDLVVQYNVKNLLLYSEKNFKIKGNGLFPNLKDFRTMRDSDVEALKACKAKIE